MLKVHEVNMLPCCKLYVYDCIAYLDQWTLCNKDMDIMICMVSITPKVLHERAFCCKKMLFVWDLLGKWYGLGQFLKKWKNREVFMIEHLAISMLS